MKSEKITICYITARRQPMFKWFVDSLISQYPDGHVDDEIVIIDLFLQYEENRKDKLSNLIDNKFNYLHIPPKPSIWLGSSRKTKRNFYDGAATRNTGIIVANTNYIVFVDDLTVLMPDWLKYHKNAAANNIVFSGAYDKVSDIVFEGNLLNSYTKNNSDCRLIAQCGDENIKSYGGWVFGTNSGFPIEFLIKTNGYDEFLSARRGGEDCNLGVRLENAGYGDKIFYNKNCLTIEDIYLHYNGENVQDDYYPIRRWKSDPTQAHEKHNFFANIYNTLEHDHLYKNKQYTTLYNTCDIAKERELYQNDKIFKSADSIQFKDFDGDDIYNI